MNFHLKQIEEQIKQTEGYQKEINKVEGTIKKNSTEPKISSLKH